MLAIVFALAFAAFNLAVAISREVISVLVQHTSDDNDGGFLSFTVFETEISYGEALYYAIAIMLLATSLYGAWLLSRHTTRICPECESQVPREASVCRYCTSELAIEDSDA